MFTKEEYINTLLAIKERLSSTHYDMLNAQYYAPDRTATTPQLASLMGRDNFYFINLQYGQLGHWLSDFLVGEPPGWNETDGYLWFKYLSSGKRSKNGYLWIMHSELADALEELGFVEQFVSPLTEEVSQTDTYSEGAVKQVIVDAYERNPFARKKCIEHYGAKCCVCEIELASVYGEVGDGFIHVHHLHPLANIHDEHIVDPIRDLRPVCPNCHAIIHRRKPPYTIEEVKKMLDETRDKYF